MRQVLEEPDEEGGANFGRIYAQKALGFRDLAPRVRTLDRKIADLDGRIEAEVEASGTTLTLRSSAWVPSWPRRF